MKETVYTSHEVSIKNTKYNVLVATGARSYIVVQKITANPFGMGKEFTSFDEAIEHYKTPKMKTELLKIKMGV